MKMPPRITLVVLCLVPWCAIAQTTSWKGTINTDWNNPANWTAGVPTASVDAIIGNTNFTGTSQPDLSGSSACRTLTIGTGTKASTLKVDKGLTVNGDVSIGPRGTINHTAAVILGVKGNWSNGGRYNASNKGATVAFSGTSQSLFAGTNSFKRMTVNAGSTTTLGASAVVDNLLTVSG